MAPEQLEGHALTLKSDVWAIGVNLWELATQKLPWADEAMRESPNGIADYDYCRRKVCAERACYFMDDRPASKPPTPQTIAAQ